ncbi:acetyl-CoA acetyltransferase [Paenibacillus sp. JX-17]|uniref:Acetyl-CoA acetyltransferase n=1 Tax=Paenibacillus lacisoli TaxID=3064525 RepID=A0ABT9C6V4_9BACL|nr:acetyl-CoA acetyltransferase [Paenibacillus sp. JX-17]MDO7904979.1 acetyl-CoA acetyltransferase [Paenibacillus sp. JX-17]
MQLPRSQQIIYQAEPSHVHMIKGLKQKFEHSCNPYLNHKVRVETLDGVTYEGMLVQMDGCHVHLQVQGGYDRRGLYNPYYYNQILPLVLFDLLTITLLL